MNNICKDWYKQYKSNYEKFIKLWNTDKNECCKKISGHSLESNAWRMIQISGAVDRMGGFANFSHYVNKCAESDYSIFKKQHKLLCKIKKNFKADSIAQKRIFSEISDYLKDE